MTGHKGNSEFCFLETLNVPLGFASGNIEVESILVKDCVKVASHKLVNRYHVFTISFAKGVGMAK